MTTRFASHAGWVFPIKRPDGAEIEATWREVMGEIEITDARHADGSPATLTMEERHEVEEAAMDGMAADALAEDERRPVREKFTKADGDRMFAAADYARQLVGAGNGWDED